MSPESKVRDYLRDECRRLGWECLPLVLPTRRGWPDRTILAPGGHVAFVELKAPGIRHDPDHLRQQKEMIDHLTALGFLAFLAVGTEEVDDVLGHLITVWGLGPPNKGEREMVVKRGNSWCVVHGHPKKPGSKTDKPPGTPIKCYPFTPGNAESEARAKEKAERMHRAILANQNR